MDSFKDEMIETCYICGDDVHRNMLRVHIYFNHSINTTSTYSSVLANINEELKVRLIERGCTVSSSARTIADQDANLTNYLDYGESSKKAKVCNFQHNINMTSTRTSDGLELSNLPDDKLKVELSKRGCPVSSLSYCTRGDLDIILKNYLDYGESCKKAKVCNFQPSNINPPPKIVLMRKVSVELIRVDSVQEGKHAKLKCPICPSHRLYKSKAQLAIHFSTHRRRGGKTLRKRTNDTVPIKVDEEYYRTFVENLEKFKTFKNVKQMSSSQAHSTLAEYEEIDKNIYIKGSKKSSIEADPWIQCNCVLTPKESAAGQMGCNEHCLNRLVGMECGPDCLLGEKCSNNVFWKKIYCSIEVFSTEKKGRGMRSLQFIPKGTFVIEYIGEVLTFKEFDTRSDLYATRNQEHFYFMSISGNVFIDATQKGNCSRFINHSCEPNCMIRKFEVGGQTRIGIFSIRDILVGEELSYDYRTERYGKEHQNCFCESKSCKGWIGVNVESSTDNEGIDVAVKTFKTDEKKQMSSILLSQGFNKRKGPGKGRGKPNIVSLEAKNGKEVEAEIEENVVFKIKKMRTIEPLLVSAPPPITTSSPVKVISDTVDQDLYIGMPKLERNSPVKSDVKYEEKAQLKEEEFDDEKVTETESLTELPISKTGTKIFLEDKVALEMKSEESAAQQPAPGSIELTNPTIKILSESEQVDEEWTRVFSEWEKIPVSGIQCSSAPVPEPEISPTTQPPPSLKVDTISNPIQNKMKNDAKSNVKKRLKSNSRSEVLKFFKEPEPKKIKFEKEAKHACTVCAKTYSTKENVTRHMKNHSGRKYDCRTCQMRFFRSDTCRDHEKIHSKQKISERKIQMPATNANTPQLQVPTKPNAEWYTFFKDAGIEDERAVEYAATFEKNLVRMDQVDDLDLEFLRDPKINIKKMGNIIKIMDHALKVGSNGKSNLQI